MRNLARRPAPECEGDPLLGSLIGGRYRVDRVQGEGGMGTVYQVTHVTLHRRMAAKVLRPELTDAGDLAVRFLQEAQAAAAIEHPNIINITDFGRLDSGQPYFVMEFLGGTSIRSLLALGPMPPERVLRIARQIAAGLAAAHQAGVIHRDLKPDNVQVDPEDGDRVKVFDFGLARVEGTPRLTKRGMVYGTPQYMSPEQVAGEAADPRTDVYALGILMYEMLTGKVPFDAKTPAAVLRQHLRAAPRRLSELMPDTDFLGLEPIVMRCLAKRPGRRFTTMEAFIAALDALLVSRGDKHPGRRKSMSDRPRPLSPAPRTWGVGLAGLVLGGAMAWVIDGQLEASDAPALLERSSVSRSAATKAADVGARRFDEPVAPGETGASAALPAPRGQGEAARGEADAGAEQEAVARPTPVGSVPPHPSAAPATGHSAGTKSYPGDIIDPWAAPRNSRMP